MLKHKIKIKKFIGEILKINQAIENCVENIKNSKPSFFWKYNSNIKLDKFIVNKVNVKNAVKKCINIIMKY